MSTARPGQGKKRGRGDWHISCSLPSPVQFVSHGSCLSISSFARLERLAHNKIEVNSCLRFLCLPVVLTRRRKRSSTNLPRSTGRGCWSTQVGRHVLLQPSRLVIQVPVALSLSQTKAGSRRFSSDARPIKTRSQYPSCGSPVRPRNSVSERGTGVHGLPLLGLETDSKPNP